MNDLLEILRNLRNTTKEHALSFPAGSDEQLVALSFHKAYDRAVLLTKATMSEVEETYAKVYMEGFRDGVTLMDSLL